VPLPWPPLNLSAAAITAALTAVIAYATTAASCNASAVATTNASSAFTPTIATTAFPAAIAATVATTVATAVSTSVATTLSTAAITTAIAVATVAVTIVSSAFCTTIATNALTKAALAAAVLSTASQLAALVAASQSATHATAFAANNPATILSASLADPAARRGYHARAPIRGDARKRVGDVPAHACARAHVPSSLPSRGLQAAQSDAAAELLVGSESGEYERRELGAGQVAQPGLQLGAGELYAMAACVDTGEAPSLPVRARAGVSIVPLLELGRLVSMTKYTDGGTSGASLFVTGTPDDERGGSARRSTRSYYLHSEWFRGSEMRAEDVDFDQMKVKQLSAELEARGEPRSGRKVQLRARLRAVIIADQLASIEGEEGEEESEGESEEEEGEE